MITFFFFSFCLFFNFTEVQLLYNVVSVSVMPQHVSVNIHLFFFIFVSVAEWQVHAPDARRGQTILKQWSLEQRLDYYRAMQGDEWFTP